MGWGTIAAPAAIPGFHRARGLVPGGLALLAHALLVAPLPVAWRGAAALLLLGLPGVLLTLLVFEDERERLTRAFLGLCGAICLAALLLLALHALPGSLYWWLVLGVFDALSLLLGVQLLSRPTAPEPAPAREPEPQGLVRANRSPIQDVKMRGSEDAQPSPLRGFASSLRISERLYDRPHLAIFAALREHAAWQYLPLLLIALLGAGLRFTYLGGAEFQGDEANVVLLGVDAVIGHDAILLLHRKGPVEVLLPTGLMALVGQLNEWAARLPFALAGMGVILGVFVLARRMLSAGVDAVERGWMAGAVAATILALDGFLIAYSRMVQYQNVVVLAMIGA